MKEFSLKQYLQTKTFMALAIFWGCLILAGLIYIIPPDAQQKKGSVRSILTVKTITVSPSNYQFILKSFGSVQPRTQSLLVSQVSGQVTKVSPAFRDGGFFKKGDKLIQIDPRDYQTAVKVAEAELLQAQAAQEEEKARSLQAKEDWGRLSNDREAPALVLRKPQLAAAEAKYYSAQANLEKAQLNLERTIIKAPYDGRIKSTTVDFGQFVNMNSQLAEVFATDLVEIRLPLKNSELGYINLPEGNTDSNSNTLPDVIINSDLGTPQKWQAKIVRTEAAIDSNSQLLHVVAQIKAPFAKTSDGKTQLKIGQYVTAEIQGKKIEQALIIPNSSVYQGSYVYVLEEGLLYRRDIRITFQSSDQAVIAEGLNFNDQLVISPMGQVASGTRASNYQIPEHQANTGETP